MRRTRDPGRPANQRPDRPPIHPPDPKQLLGHPFDRGPVPGRDGKRRTFAAHPPGVADADRWRKRWEKKKAAGGRPPLSDAELRRVADVYSRAWNIGKDPTMAVMKDGGVAYGTAAKRVMRARKRGFLLPTSKGRSGGVPIQAPKKTRRKKA